MTEITLKNIVVEKSARYFVLNENAEEPEEMWFVLHGYGQNAEEFLKIFSAFAGTRKIIIAPEALNRFYIKRFTGKTGASWMTREDRENEISDYTAYLTAIYKLTAGKYRDGDIKINVLGFSQGTATACRWIAAGGLKFSKLVLWGGGIPPDVELSQNRSLLNSLSLKMIIGDKDEFVTPEKLTAEEDRMKTAGIKYKLIRYEGYHSITAELFERFAGQI